MSGKDFRTYNQAQLDAQYDQRTLVPDMSGYFHQWREEGDRAGTVLKPQAGLAYGTASEETLDIFVPEKPAQRLHVHYHGGAWRALSSREAWFIAPPWVNAGYTFVSVNFGLVPDVSLARQVDQARRALAWCGENAERLGVTPDRISVSGHSSGAHLAALAGLVEWGRIKPNVEAVLLASGIFDLEPVRHSARNTYLCLGEADARILSPSRMLPETTPPCGVLWSVNELDEFQRQSLEFASCLERTGLVERHPSNVPTHFDTWDLLTPSRLESLLS